MAIEIADELFDIADDLDKRRLYRRFRLQTENQVVLQGYRAVGAQEMRRAEDEKVRR